MPDGPRLCELAPRPGFNDLRPEGEGTRGCSFMLPCKSVGVNRNLPRVATMRPCSDATPTEAVVGDDEAKHMSDPSCGREEGRPRRLKERTGIWRWSCRSTNIGRMWWRNSEAHITGCHMVAAGVVPPRTKWRVKGALYGLVSSPQVMVHSPGQGLRSMWQLQLRRTPVCSQTSGGLSMRTPQPL